MIIVIHEYYNITKKMFIINLPKIHLNMILPHQIKQLLVFGNILATGFILNILVSKFDYSLFKVPLNQPKLYTVCLKDNSNV